MLGNISCSRVGNYPCVVGSCLRVGNYPCVLCITREEFCSLKVVCMLGTTHAVYL